MLLAAAAVVVTSTAQPTHAPIETNAQAVATVRIISAVRLHFGDSVNDADVPPPRWTVIHGSDSREQPARLFEFQ